MDSGGIAGATFDNLTAQECMNIYTNLVVSGHGSVIVLSNNMSSAAEPMLLSTPLVLPLGIGLNPDLIWCVPPCPGLWDRDVDMLF